VPQGNKIFGAAVLHSSDLSAVIAGTNNGTKNLPWHGEIQAVKQRCEMADADASKRRFPEESILPAAHEACRFCASAMARGGYGDLFYLFSHDGSRECFHIGYDPEILGPLLRLGHESMRAGTLTGPLAGSPT
jgi:tRNA(Arg) A34 adenosine deaminase TadA